jgi:hypothetical protein
MGGGVAAEGRQLVAVGAAPQKRVDMARFAHRERPRHGPVPTYLGVVVRDLISYATGREREGES